MCIAIVSLLVVIVSMSIFPNIALPVLTAKADRETSYHHAYTQTNVEPLLYPESHDTLASQTLAHKPPHKDSQEDSTFAQGNLPFSSSFQSVPTGKTAKDIQAESHSHSHQSFLQSNHQPSCNPQSDPLNYHDTDDLLSKLLHTALECPFADAEWTAVTSLTSQNSVKVTGSKATSGQKTNSVPTFNVHHLAEPNIKHKSTKILVITLTRGAKMRNAARRAGRSIPTRPAIIATFGEHGRERVTSELALRILARYCPLCPQHTTVPPELDTAELILIPVLNEHGRRTVEQGHDCWRLNERGVDLNRNYRYKWGVHDASTLHEEESCGRAPLSEFETRAVDAIVARFNPIAYLSVHSGDSAVVVPWDARADGEPASKFVADAAYKVAQAHCVGCPVGSAATLFGYQAYGTAVDHMLAVRNVPLALTIEVWRGNETFCKDMFNPLTKASLATVFANWSGVLRTTLDIVTPKGLSVPIVVSSDSASFLRDVDRVEVIGPSKYGEDNYVAYWTRADNTLESTDESQIVSLHQAVPSPSKPVFSLTLRRAPVLLLPIAIIAICRGTFISHQTRRRTRRSMRSYRRVS